MSRFTRIGKIYIALALIWGNFCLLFLLANWAVRLWTDHDAGGQFASWVDNPPRFITEAFEINYPDWSEQERDQLWQESSIGFRHDPLVQYREVVVSGKYVNVTEDGYRVGRDQGPWPPDPANFNVFLLGGSTGFGYGVPDDETISSHLQKMLPAVNGQRVFVYNFARGGFNSTMERVLFEKMMTVGPVPDLAIFLDGVNDMGYPAEPPAVNRVLTEEAEATDRSPIFSALSELSLVKAIRGGAKDLGGAGVDGAVPKEVHGKKDQGATVKLAIDRYAKNKAAIEAIGSTRNVASFFVWQPAPVYKYDLNHHTYKEKSFGGHERSRIGFPLMRAYVDSHDLGRNFHWCADIQEGISELLYVDRMHYSAGMSQRVARCMADGLLQSGMLQ